jgi:hypothetical protein
VSSKDDIVTLTTPNGSDTITVTAEADWLTDITTMDDIVFNDDCDTFTIPDFDDALKWDDVFLNNTVKIGNTEITAVVWVWFFIVPVGLHFYVTVIQLYLTESCGL